MGNSHKFIKGVLIFLFLIPFIGCSTPIPIEPMINAYTYWKDGEGHQYAEFSVSTIERASIRSFNRLKLGVVTNERIDNGVKLVAGSQQQFNLRIVEVAGTSASRISLRVNFLGDRDLTELFFKILNEEIYTVRFDSSGNPIY